MFGNIVVIDGVIQSTESYNEVILTTNDLLRAQGKILDEQNGGTGRGHTGFQEFG